MGAFSYFGPDANLAKRVLSQAKRIARAMYSNPPVHGARIVAEVVGDEGTFNKWRNEMEGMAGRIQVLLSFARGRGALLNRVNDGGTSSKQRRGSLPRTV